MLKKYLFISNSNKPTVEQSNSREPIRMDNVKKPCLDTAHEMGYEIWLGVNRNNPDSLTTEAPYPVHLFDSHTYRSLTAWKDNFTAYQNMMEVLRQGDFDVIHCNTPIGGVIGRLCGRKTKVRKIVYTAHGFHFYKGAPFFNRTVLKFAEKLMARSTDAILTMNSEDFEAAKKFKLRKGGKVYYVPGVGIDTAAYRKTSTDHQELRTSLGFGPDDIVCISLGDLIPRKNYDTAIEAISKCSNYVHYCICGQGPELESLKKLSDELNVSDRVHFLGFRTDVKDLLQAADVFLFTTKQEGMPRSMMEAMASGLPCLASRIRGNVDLLMEGAGGYLLHVSDAEGFGQRIQQLADDKDLRRTMGQNNLERIKEFDVSKVKKEIEKIYAEVFA